MMEVTSARDGNHPILTYNKHLSIELSQQLLLVDPTLVLALDQGFVLQPHVQVVLELVMVRHDQVGQCVLLYHYLRFIVNYYSPATVEMRPYVVYHYLLLVAQVFHLAVRLKMVLLQKLCHLRSIFYYFVRINVL